MENKLFKEFGKDLLFSFNNKMDNLLSALEDTKTPIFTHTENGGTHILEFSVEVHGEDFECDFDAYVEAIYRTVNCFCTSEKDQIEKLAYNRLYDKSELTEGKVRYSIKFDTLSFAGVNAFLDVKQAFMSIHKLINEQSTKFSELIDMMEQTLPQFDRMNEIEDVFQDYLSRVYNTNFKS